MRSVASPVRALLSLLAPGLPASQAAVNMTISDQVPSHHIASPSWYGPRFDNPWPTWTGDKKFSEMMQWMKEKRAMGVPDYGWLLNNKTPTMEELGKLFAVHPIDAAALASPPADAVQAVWVGHATMFIQMDGFSFLTDPVFSQRCSPVQFAGPIRVTPPAFEIEEAALPHLDFILLSHNHYDHLDYNSVKRLHKRYGDGLKWYIPLGLKSWFNGVGITNVQELDWWQEVEHTRSSSSSSSSGAGSSGAGSSSKGEAGTCSSSSSIRIAMTPAQHWSARGIADRRQTLWGGYAVMGAQQRFWFAGDTGYCPAFTEIGERYGPFDLAAIPTGAYGPRWFMSPQHIDPKEAVQVHQEVRSKRSVAIHCCTFALASESLDEPVLLLEQEAAAAGLQPGEFVTLKHGGLIQTSAGTDRNVPAVMKLA